MQNFCKNENFAKIFKKFLQNCKNFLHMQMQKIFAKAKILKKDQNLGLWVSGFVTFFTIFEKSTKTQPHKAQKEPFFDFSKKSRKK